MDLDPWGSWNFRLELSVSGRMLGPSDFLECSGLKNATQPFEIPEGGWNGHVHRRPGQSKWEDLVLRSCSGPSLDLLRWRDAWLAGWGGGLGTGAVIILDVAGRPLRRFCFEGAWPVGWEGPSLDGNRSELAIESLTLAHSGLWVEEIRGRTA